jgi:hypothetical protein
MKVKVLVEKEFDIKSVELSIAVRYDEEDIPNDFPFRDGNMWNAKIDIDSGKVIDWPIGKVGLLSMKVCDEGTYRLFDENGNMIKEIENDYVPNNLLPGSYGDYIDLDIDESGLIINWYKYPNFEDFFPDND